MRLPEFEHSEPESLEEACEQLSRHKGEVNLIAGGTDLLASMKQRVKTPKYLVDIKTLPDLKSIRFDKMEGLKIGALVTHRELMTNREIREKYPVLAEAASVIGAPQLQAMGTIGGNLCLDTRCWFYNQSHWWRKAREACLKLGGNVCHVEDGGKCLAPYQGDMASALIALNAQIRLLKKGGEKTIPLKEFYTGNGKAPNILGEDEILTEVLVAVPAEKSGASYEKLRLRNAIDFPQAGAAVNMTLEDGSVCKKARVVINALGPSPQVVNNVDEVLGAKEIKDALVIEVAEAAYKEANPAETMPGSPEYRREMVKVLVKKSFQNALERARL